jgi:hypothetical protein
MTLIIYHEVKPGTACPDGLAAAFCAARAYPDATLVGCVYGDPMPPCQDGENVIIVDFSFPREYLEALADRGCKVTVLDHHKTAWENLANLSARVEAKFELQECGATLTWKHFFPDEPVPEFLNYVRDRDLWNWELELSEEINEAIANSRHELTELARAFNLPSHALVFKFFELLCLLDRNELLQSLAPKGIKLLEPKRKQVLQAASRFVMCKLPDPAPVDFEIPVVFCAEDGSEDRLVSDICSKLYSDIKPDAQFVACVLSGNKWSLRSNKKGSNYDVSKIAEHYNGGGHVNASGFEA